MSLIKNHGVGACALWATLTSCLASGELPQDSIKFKLDPQSIQHSIANGGIVSLPWGDVVVESDLSVPTEARLITLYDDGRQEEVVYATQGFGIGSARDLQDSLVAISAIEGIVHASLFLDGQWWFIEPLASFEEAGPMDYVAYNASSIGRIAFHDVVVPHQDDPGSIGDHDPQPSITKQLRVALVADSAFWTRTKRSPLQWWQHQRVLMHHVSATYRRYAAVSFIPAVHVLDLRTNGLTANKSDKLLNQLRETSLAALGETMAPDQRERLGIDLVHLTTGKKLERTGFLGLGQIMGRAHEPGVHGLSTQHGVAYRSGTRILNGDQMFFMGHELGHSLNAVHGQADRWKTSDFILWANWATTLLGGGRDQKVHEISRGTRRASRNNVRRIRTHLTERSGMPLW